MKIDQTVTPPQMFSSHFDVAGGPTRSAVVREMGWCYNALFVLVSLCRCACVFVPVQFFIFYVYIYIYMYIYCTHAHIRTSYLFPVLISEWFCVN